MSWQKHEEEFLKSNYKYMTNKEMGVALGRSKNSVCNRLNKLNLRRDHESKDRLRNKSFFQKGYKPWNKGIKGLHLSPMTEFKKGHKPFNTKYDGYISIRRDSKSGRLYKYIRISEGKWKEYHRFLWEKKHGEIPESHVLRFKNGDTMDCRLDNLELISRAEHCRRNYSPPKLTDEYCAFTLAHLSEHTKEEMLENKELIKLQRTKLQLRREIRKWQKT